MAELRVVEALTEEDLIVQGYPPSLAKACFDPFEYAMQLRCGTVLHFELARPRGEWVHLEFGQYTPCEHLPFGFERGMDVRVYEIVWCADAPNGS